MEEDMVNVAIFDDSESRCESLMLLISQTTDMQVTGTYRTGQNASDHVSKCHADVVLMDIDMPVVNGIEATAAIRKSYPKLIILMQTIAEDDENLFKSIQAGASGYILKKTHPDKIIEAMRDALQGGAPLSPAMAFKMLKFFQVKKSVETISDPYGISLREKDILGSLVEGNSYKMIAHNLNISYHTVNSHIRKIYEKLHVHSIGEAISKALKEDLLK